MRMFLYIWYILIKQIFKNKHYIVKFNNNELTACINKGII